MCTCDQDITCQLHTSPGDRLMQTVYKAIWNCLSVNIQRTNGVLSMQCSQIIMSTTYRA